MSPWTDKQIHEDQARYRRIKAMHQLTAWDRQELFSKKRRYGEFREFLKTLELRYRGTTGPSHKRGPRPKGAGPFTPRPEAPDDHGSAGKDEGTNGPAMHKLSEEQR